MSSTLAIVRKQNPRKLDESEQDYRDRMMIEAAIKLHHKNKRNENEELELKKLEGECIAIQISRGGYLPMIHTDKEMQPAALRLHKDLSAQFGEKSPLKVMLIDRLVAAWNMANVFETQLDISKYKRNENGSITLTFGDANIKLMREVRKGIESANDQIIRLAQVLQNLTNPPIQVKATNAFIAQNQQVNQGAAPKDLATIDGRQS
ncbi:MAG: hypothetical protein PHE68_02550 [Candidatus Peribacteraceae bacterium]|nr:hypothetical protein [Candidatus Peribacteraceae bacterium]